MQMRKMRLDPVIIFYSAIDNHFQYWNANVRIYVTKKINSLQIYFFSLKQMLVNQTGVDLQAINVFRK